jgi:hypothetical protein
MKKLTKEQKREIAAIAAKKDEDIDLSGMPEVIDWSGGAVPRWVSSIALRRGRSPCAWTRTWSNG